MENSKNLAILILAAGSSKRLGEPKQLLKYKDKTLIEIAIEKALQISSNVTVILGAEEKEISKIVSNYPIDIKINPNYMHGIGNSISFGINEIKEIENCLIMLCDQPFIPTSHLQNLVKNSKDELLIASNYDSSPTVPAIFPKRYYPQLLALKGDKGAKSILIKEKAFTIKLEKEFALDIDTKNDVINFLKNKS